jgi:hypothetical protein
MPGNAQDADSLRDGSLGVISRCGPHAAVADLTTETFTR